MLAQPEIETTQGKRGRAILAVLLGCALRRSELAALESRHIHQRDGRWVFVDLVGKGQRIRTVPIPPFVKVVIGPDDGGRFIGGPIVAANGPLQVIGRNDLQRAQYRQVISRCGLPEDDVLVLDNGRQQVRFGQRLAADVVSIHSGDARCRVSFTDSDGILHGVDLEAIRARIARMRAVELERHRNSVAFMAKRTARTRPGACNSTTGGPRWKRRRGKGRLGWVASTGAGDRLRNWSA